MKYIIVDQKDILLYYINIYYIIILILVSSVITFYDFHIYKFTIIQVDEYFFIVWFFCSMWNH